MNKLLLITLFSLVSSMAFASDFCGRRQPDIHSHLLQPYSRLAFKNGGGLLNKGVCWWHNRFQRSAAYLISFNPGARKSSDRIIQKKIASLMKMDRVVTINGYRDLASFSRDYKNEIQSILNAWQRIDGVLNFEWIRGISGQSELSSYQMELRMEDVYKHYKSSPVPLWIMAQIKGVTSHSFLILNMGRTDHGFVMDVIDSNKPMVTITIQYQRGDLNLSPPGEKYSFVPYVGFQNDFRKISRSLKNHCPEKDTDFNFNVEDGDIENYLQY